MRSGKELPLLVGGGGATCEAGNLETNKEKVLEFLAFLLSGSAHLSLGNEVGHDGRVSELGGQVDAAAALAIDQGRVGAVFHELHHHG